MKISKHSTILLFLGVVCISFLLSSCKKKETFAVQVVNNSGYDITSIKFGCTVSGDDLSVNNGDTSETLTLSYEKRLRLTPKLICLWIDFDDQGTNFAAVLTGHMPFVKKDVKNGLNTIVITSEQSSDTLFFNNTLN